MNDTRLKKWFINRIYTVMEHNDYEKDCITVEKCNEKGLYTPVDLMIREELNNGSGSAKGFLGLTPRQNRECYEYCKQNKDLLIENNLVNKSAYNNSGFLLWDNYNYDF